MENTSATSYERAFAKTVASNIVRLPICPGVRPKRFEPFSWRSHKEFDEDHLYRNLDWLEEHHARIEERLYRELYPAGQCPELFLYDVTLFCQLYDTGRPLVLLYLQAQPIIAGTLFELEKLRCAACGQLFSATTPAEAGQEKYAPNVAPMLAVLHYGYGLPMNRMAQMQKDFGVPLPSGTQGELIDEHFLELAGVYEGFLRYAADGEIFFNDDTPVKQSMSYDANSSISKMEHPII